MSGQDSLDPQRMRRREKVVAKIETFPSMPTFIVKAVELLSDPAVDLDQVSNAIRYDPGLTANILRFANSAQYGDARAVHDVHEALVRLGVKKALELTVAYGIADNLIASLSGYNLEPKELLKHSVSVAVTSEKLCRVLDIELPSMLFTAGILHDLGKVILDEFIGKYYQELNTCMEEGQFFFEEAEEKVIGISHAEVGAELLRLWRLPDALVSAARWHHHPEAAGSYLPVASVVHVADVLSYALGVGTGVDGLKQRPCRSVVESFNISHKAVDQIVVQSYYEVDELTRLLSPAK